MRGRDEEQGGIVPQATHSLRSVGGGLATVFCAVATLGDQASWAVASALLVDCALAFSLPEPGWVPSPLASVALGGASPPAISFPFQV